MLSTDDVAAMQATMVESLPDTCTLVVDTLASDGAGGQTATPGDPVTVACRVSPLRLTRSSANAEVVEEFRIVEQSLWLITMPYGTTVTPQHRIGHAGRTFEVVEVLSPRTWGVDTRVSCKLVNAGQG
jgi:hypothetical protein